MKEEGRRERKMKRSKEERKEGRVLYDGIELNQLMRGRNERQKKLQPSISPFISGIFLYILPSIIV